MENKFSWTQEYRRSWEVDSKKDQELLPAQTKTFNANRKCIIRHLLVAIDTSSSIEKSDYVPTIRNIVSTTLPRFIELFKQSNPLSILSFMTCKSVFEKYSKEFDPNHLLNSIGSGDFSFLNCLKSGIEFLKDNTYTAELLVITASIKTKDSGSYDQVLSEIKKNNIKINIISVCGEVTLFKKVCSISNGLFCVPMNSYDLENILVRFAEPLESLESTNVLVKLGFPKLAQKSGICTCHLKFHSGLYECPVCHTDICSLPSQCPICETQLVSPLNISKSYYYLYPLKPFELNSCGSCSKCGLPSKTQCQNCNSYYCEKCDYFVQNSLNFCVFC